MAPPPLILPVPKASSCTASVLPLCPLPSGFRKKVSPLQGLLPSEVSSSQPLSGLVSPVSRSPLKKIRGGDAMVSVPAWLICSSASHLCCSYAFTPEPWEPLPESQDCGSCCVSSHAYCFLSLPGTVDSPASVELKAETRRQELKQSPWRNYAYCLTSRIVVTIS